MKTSSSLLLLLMLTLLLSGCGSEPGPAGPDAFNKNIVGYWYGEEKSKHLQIYWIYEYRPDKTFTLKTLEVDRGDTKTTTVSGTWQYKNGIFTETVTRDNLGTDRSTGQPSRYKVKSLTSNEFAYTELDTGKSFVDKRVSADFALPVPKPRAVKKRKKRRLRKKKHPALTPRLDSSQANKKKHKERSLKTGKATGEKGTDDDIEVIIRGLKVPKF